MPPIGHTSCLDAACAWASWQWQCCGGRAGLKGPQALPHPLITVLPLLYAAALPATQSSAAFPEVNPLLKLSNFYFVPLSVPLTVKDKDMSKSFWNSEKFPELPH